MSSKEHAERLAHALSSLSFVQALNAEFGYSNVQILCRVQRGAEAKWAQVVEKILLAAESVQGQEHYWVSHICRLYFVRDGKMVYGWHVGITSNFMDESLNEIIRSFVSERPPSPLPVARGQQPIPKVQTPRRPAGVLEADVRGNPKVPASHRVTEVPMAGLDPNLDRNHPTDTGVGAFGMYGSKRLGQPFRPPKGGGKVGSGNPRGF